MKKFEIPTGVYPDENRDGMTKSGFSILLPDIRSGWNVGAFFRTADGLHVEHIYLTGITPYPPHKEIVKTALGAENMVPWSYHVNSEDVVKELKMSGITIVALETGRDSISIEKFIPKFPLCLIVGNEIDGIPETILKLTDEKICIPMRGKKESFNVAIAGAIAMWEIAKHKIQSTKQKK
ncbi:RNA methyltransferase [Candidatus Peregrinibacteria bacterium]|nr:RNA methyltransferase [Candidatus Peregrinibacteria bacterium]